MTDPETIRRVLSPTGQQAAQILRDLSIIYRIELLVRNLGRSQR